MKTAIVSPVPALRLHLAHLLGLGRPMPRAALPLPVQLRSRARRASSAPSGAPIRAADFAHLAPPAAPDMPELLATVRSPAAHAAAICAAANKARHPIPPAPLPAKSLAAQVIAAAARARSPTPAAPLPTDPVARAVILAGKRRRGEIV